jgi:hypothetical protein
MTQIPTLTSKSSVGTPTYEYESMVRIWKRCRAILNGELYAKEHDRYLDQVNYTNLLVPFSPRMSAEQYRWYVAEAELPGLTSQYAKILTGGLLRKPPEIMLPETVPEDAISWLRNRFTEDGRPIVAFLDAAIWEELSTSRGWVSVDFPVVPNYADLDPDQKQMIAPYPVLWRAEDVINWQTGIDKATGRPTLTRVVFRYIGRTYKDSDWHPNLDIVAADHYLDEAGIYRVQYYKKEGEATVDLINGDIKMTQLFGTELFSNDHWIADGELITPMMWGAPMTQLPIFPLNGEVTLEAPMLTPLIDKEIALYNKVSRRNHLLYGAATFTPVVFSDMSNEDFAQVVNAGLGSWIKLGSQDKIDAFKTPTDALSDMDRAIEGALAEMSRFGTQILAPDARTGDSGIALEIRNSSITAQLGLLNNKLSATMAEVLKLMLRWRYGKDIEVEELKFKLSADFNPTPLGSEWTRLVTEWYQNRLIPRSVWLSVAKQHDIIPNDYDDAAGMEEIGQDPLIQDNSGLTIEEGV